MPFPVLLDEDGSAAQIVATHSLRPASLLRPDAIGAGIRSFRSGHRQHQTGRRPMQLGATLVIGPGDELVFVDRERFAGDHADIDAVLAVLS